MGMLVSGDAPVSYWRLDEAAGPIAVDEMAANPGLYQGTPVYGRAGRCVGSACGGGVVGWVSGDDVVVWVMCRGWRVMCRLSCG